jgi:hypothetical protein
MSTINHAVGILHALSSYVLVVGAAEEMSVYWVTIGPISQPSLLYISSIHELEN